jgi:hypothetical protein
MVRKVGRPWSLILEFCKRLSSQLTIFIAVRASAVVDFAVRRSDSSYLFDTDSTGSSRG